MKKFFGILLAAVSALVLLPGCGGGGDQEEATRMTVEQFASGSKYFELRTGNGTVFVLPRIGQAPYPLTKNEGNTKGKDGVKGTVQHGKENSPHDATFNYVAEYGEDGLPLSAILYVTLTDTPSEDDPVCAFLNIQGIVDDDDDDGGNGGGNGGGDGGEDVTAQAVQINLFFDSGKFEVVGGASGFLYVYPQ